MKVFYKYYYVYNEKGKQIQSAWSGFFTSNSDARTAAEADAIKNKRTSFSLQGKAFSVFESLEEYDEETTRLARKAALAKLTPDEIALLSIEV